MIIYKRGVIVAEKKISGNAKKAEEIKNKMSKEVRLATEAMQRTARARKTNVLSPRKYKYQEIF